MAHFKSLRIAALFMLYLIPVTIFSQPDETMPSSIPADIVADWKKQDKVSGSDYAAAIKKIKAALPEEYASKVTGSSSENDYLTACHWRRVAKMKPHLSSVKKILYAKHHNQGGGIVGFLSELRSDRGSSWSAGGGLYILTMDNYYPKPEILLEDATGVIKDPNVSYDGKKVVFAWWKSSFGSSGAKIFEIDVETKQTRQITKDPLDLQVGDYEPCYMPTGDIMFTSTRLYSMVNCAYNTVGNMYICNKNGEWLRKIGFDQEATFTPVMMSTGDVLYSRWEYNDRTRISASGIFTMNPDGTRQNELWGNQSDFPLMKYHTREIPNSDGKLMGIAGDHLAPYQGEIVVIDPQISRNNYKGNENGSIKLIAPVRKAPVDPSTAMSGNSGGQIKYLFQFPWPFDTANCLVSWREKEADKIFKIYFFNQDASRELFAWDSKMSVSQPVVMDARRMPPLRALQADYTKETGIFSMVDVNFGMGAKGIPAGKIKKLRVIALDYRTNYSTSQGVDGFAVNPIGRAFTSWLVKTLVGDMPVAEDGSACFIAPANTPLFFQTIDADGRMVNTMRSWTTLMPGERFDCVGCHEDKNESPPPKVPMAVTPLPLEKPLGIEGQAMSFPKIIQPILDKHCISCHDASHKTIDLRANPKFVSAAKKTFNSSYSNLTKSQRKYVDWITQEEKAAPRTKFPVPGSSTSPLAEMLLKGHKTDKNKITPRELEILFCWIDMMVPHGGTYYEGMAAADSTKYVTYLNNHRNKHLEWEKANMKAFVDAGQWQNPIYGKTDINDGRYFDNLNASNTNIAATQLKIIRVSGNLAVQCPGAGIISLLDMKGRTLMKLSTTAAANNGTSQTILPMKMPAGIYIIRFSGNGIVKQRVLTCLSPKGDHI